MTKIRYTLAITPRFNARVRDNADVLSAMNELKERLEKEYVFSSPDENESYTAEIVFGLDKIHVVLRNSSGVQVNSDNTPFSSETTSQNLVVGMLGSIGKACSAVGSVEAASPSLMVPGIKFMEAFCHRIRTA